jgi:hypothetical protein
MDERTKAVIDIISRRSLDRPITAREICEAMKVLHFSITPREIAEIASATRDGKCEAPILALKGKRGQQGYYPGNSVEALERWIAEMTNTVNSESMTLYAIRRLLGRKLRLAAGQEDCFGHGV